MTRCPWCFGPLTDAGPPSGPSPCPHCAKELLPRWRDTPTTCIAMAGARATGKSIFIAVMIKQLEQFADQVGMDVAPASEDVRRVFEEVYEKPLYKERGIMRPTPPSALQDSYQRTPLIFVITARDGARHHLVIRDVAGEDLEKSDEVDVGELAFFPHSDVVFFLFDPLRVEDIRARLADLVPEGLLGGDPRVVLGNTLRLLQGGSPRLGVILSKFDAMQALRSVEGAGEWTRIMLNPGAAFFRDPGPTVRAEDADGEQLHEEVRSLLLKLGSGSLVASVERAGHGAGGEHRFFAVSALGDPPSGARLNSRGIAPFRCLDPIRWALAGSGALR